MQVSAPLKPLPYSFEEGLEMDLSAQIEAVERDGRRYLGMCILTYSGGAFYSVAVAKWRKRNNLPPVGCPR